MCSESYFCYMVPLKGKWQIESETNRVYAKPQTFSYSHFGLSVLSYKVEEITMTCGFAIFFPVLSFLKQKNKAKLEIVVAWCLKWY